MKRETFEMNLMSSLLRGDGSLCVTGKDPDRPGFGMFFMFRDSDKEKITIHYDAEPIDPQSNEFNRTAFFVTIPEAVDFLDEKGLLKMVNRVDYS